MRGIGNQPQQAIFGGQPAIIAAAAHELKTPLTLIHYLAQMLGDDTLGLAAHERLQYVQRLQTVSKRTLRLVQQLTVSYRLEESGQAAFMFALEPVNTRQVCEAALHELTPLAQEYKQQLQLPPQSRAPLAVANREILYDVVVNLVDNAIRHTAPGGTVHVKPLTRGQHVRLHVHDNGEGIAAHELSRLRSTLGRAPQPLSGHAGSSGLGLYIAGQLAGAMGGTLGLGRARQGTTFFIDLMRSHQMGLW